MGQALSDSESEPESIVDMTVYLASLGIGVEGMDLVEVHQMHQAVVESLGDSLVGVPPAGSSSEIGFPAGEGDDPPVPSPPASSVPSSEMPPVWDGEDAGEEDLPEEAMAEAG